MAVSQAARMAILVASFGLLAFILGVVAENKKPPSGIPVKGDGIIICKFPSDPTVAFGALSVVSLFIATLAGLLAIHFPYNGKPVPGKALFRSTTLCVFFVIAVLFTIAAEVLMLWATIAEAHHRTRNVHLDMDTACTTAKTGIFGGAGFLALDASLFWLICQMMAMNARADYLDEDDPSGEYGQVMTTDFEVHRSHPVA